VAIRAIELYCNSDKNSVKPKHIDIKFLIIKDNVHNHIVSIDSVSTIFNITDSLITGLSPEVFSEHVAHMEMASHDDILVQWEWIILCNSHHF